MITFYTPAKVLYGRGTLLRLGEESKNLGNRVLFIATSGARVAKSSGFYNIIMSSLKDAGLEVFEFIDVENNPSIETCNRGADYARSHDVDLIVAFGGGSAMDAAKAIAVSASLGGDVKEYLFPSIVKGSVMPVIAIPTTCGTGSEVTKYAVLTDIKSKMKVVIAGYPIVPKVALVDSETLETLPPDLVAWTAMDALSHAIEAYITKSPTPLSDALSLEVVSTVLKHLINGYRKDPKALEKLHLGATMAGLAINITGTNLIHGLGYPLTVDYGVHHGLANALIMPHALIRMQEALRDERLEKLLKAADSKSFKDFLYKLCDLMDSVKMPAGLKDLHIPENYIDKAADSVMKYRRNLEKAPIQTSKELIVEVLKNAFIGREKADYCIR